MKCPRPLPISAPSAAALLGLAWALAALAPPAAAQVFHVPGDFASVAEAAALAPDGSALLVAPGANADATVRIEGKGLSILADGEGVILRRVELLGVPPGAVVVLAGLTIDPTGQYPLPALHEGLAALDVFGCVRVEGCTLLGSGGWNGTFFDSPHADGFNAAWLRNCASVAFHDCVLVGGRGANLDDEDVHWYVGNGGPALYVQNSVVSVTSSILRGGDAGDITDTVSDNGGRGGAGAHLDSGSAYFGSSNFVAGDGGDADCDFFAGDCGLAGGGGHGLVLETPLASASLRYTGFLPGVPGSGFEGQVDSPGLPYWVLAGTLTVFPSALPKFTVPSDWAREGDTVTVSIQGTSGMMTWLFVSPLMGSLPVAGLHGQWLFDPASPPMLIVTGTVPAGQSGLTVPFTVPELGPGVEHVAIQLQAAVQFPYGGWGPLIGPDAVLELLDADA